MTVQQLIDKLSTFGRDKLVFCQNLDEGICNEVIDVAELLTEGEANKVLLETQPVDIDDERF